MHSQQNIREYSEVWRTGYPSMRTSMTNPKLSLTQVQLTSDFSTEIRWGAAVLRPHLIRPAAECLTNEALGPVG
jgi:hypothetical protein